MQTKLKLKTTTAVALSFLFILSGISFAENIERRGGPEEIYAYGGNRDSHDRKFNKRGRKGPKRDFRREDRRPPHHRGLHFSNTEFMKKRLNLSDVQITKIGKINLQFKKAHLTIRENLEPKKIQLKKLLLDENINLSKVKSKLQEIEKYHTERTFLRIKHRVEIENVLTKKQKEKLKNERRFKNRHRGHRGR